jgi:hypothetical protein
VATAAREILKRHERLIELLQEGLATAPAGTGTGASPGVVPRLPGLQPPANGGVTEGLGQLLR